MAPPTNGSRKRTSTPPAKGAENKKSQELQKGQLKAPSPISSAGSPGARASAALGTPAPVQKKGPSSRSVVFMALLVALIAFFVIKKSAPSLSTGLNDLVHLGNETKVRFDKYTQERLPTKVQIQSERLSELMFQALLMSKASYEKVSSFSTASYEKVSKFAAPTYEKVSRFAAPTYEKVSKFVAPTYEKVSKLAAPTFTKVASFAGVTYEKVSSFAGATYEKVLKLVGRDNSSRQSEAKGDCGVDLM